MFIRNVFWGMLAVFLSQAASAQTALISGGNAYTLALTADGNVYSWGDNTNGQLGRSVASAYTADPGIVNYFADKKIGIKAVDAGSGAHALALDCRGRVWAWGLFTEGQLGNGINSQSIATNPSGSNQYSIPDVVRAGETNISKPMDTLRGITQVSAGTVQSYAVTADKKLISWGLDASAGSATSEKGTLGTGGKGWKMIADYFPSQIGLVDESPLPVYVINGHTGLPLQNVISVKAGDCFGYALVDDDNDGDPLTGRVYAWGHSWGATSPVIAADGYTHSSTMARLVVDDSKKPITGICTISAGLANGYFIQKATGYVYSVGADWLGQRGLLTSSNDNSKPYATLVKSGALKSKLGSEYLRNVVSIAAGNTHTIASVNINGVGYAVTWGGNVVFFKGAQVATGALSQSKLTAEFTAIPDFVTYANGDTLKYISEVSSGAGNCMAVQDLPNGNRKIWIWGNNKFGQLGTPVPSTYSGQPIELKLPAFLLAVPCPRILLRRSAAQSCPAMTSGIEPVRLSTEYTSNDFVYSWSLDGKVVGTESSVLAKKTGVYRLTVSPKDPLANACGCAAVSDSITVDFTSKTFAQKTFILDNATAKVELEGRDGDIFALYGSLSDDTPLAKDTVAGGVAQFSFDAASLQRVKYNSNGVAYPDNEFHVRGYVGDKSEYHIAIPTKSLGTNEIVISKNDKIYYHRVTVKTANALVNSVDYNVSRFFSAAGIVVQPIICGSMINNNGEELADETKILYTGKQYTINATGIVTIPVNLTLTGNVTNGISYWIGLKIISGEGQCTTSQYENTDFPIADIQNKAVVFDAVCRGHSTTLSQFIPALSAPLHNFKITTYTEYPCGPAPIDFRISRASAASAGPMFYTGTPYELCVKDTVRFKPKALVAENNAPLCHNVYYFKGKANLDSLKQAGMSGAYATYPAIRHIDSLPVLRIPYSIAGSLTIVVADALFPEDKTNWTAEHFYFLRHPLTSLAVQPSQDFCPGNKDSIAVKLTGTAPFKLSLMLGGMNVDTTTSRNELRFPIGADPKAYSFKAVSLSDASCSAFVTQDYTVPDAQGQDSTYRDTIRATYTVLDYPAVSISKKVEFVAGQKDPVDLKKVYFLANTNGVSADEYSYSIIGADQKPVRLTGGLWDISDPDAKGTSCFIFAYNPAKGCPYVDTFCLDLIPAPRYLEKVTLTDGTDPLAGIHMTIAGKTYTTAADGTIELANLLAGQYPYSISTLRYATAIGLLEVPAGSVTIALAKIPVIEKDSVADVCGQFTFGDTVLTASGRYERAFAAANGLDSIVTLDLHIKPVYDINLVKTIAYNETFTLGKRTLNESGTYTELLTSSEGCDSTVNIKLTVTPKPVITNEITKNACGNYQFGDTLIGKSGKYVRTFVTANDIDSVVTLNLAVHPIYATTIDATVAEGEEFIFGNHSYREAASISNLLTSVDGCDSTVNFTLAISPKQFIQNITTVKSCGGYASGDSVIVHSGSYKYNDVSKRHADTVLSNEITVGTQYSIRNRFTVTITVIEHQDYLNVIINPVYVIDTALTIAAGAEYRFGTQTLTKSGDYTEVFTSVDGCDSTVNLALTVSDKLIITNEITEKACGSYQFGDTLIAKSGKYVRKFVTANDIDSVVTLNLTVNPVFVIDIAKTISAGTEYTFGTQTLTKSGNYSEVFTSVDGCDSTVNLALSVSEKPLITNEISAKACGAYQFGDTLIAKSGQYIRKFVTANDIDSVVTLNLTIGTPVRVQKKASIDAGEIYQFGKQNLTLEGSYVEVFTSAEGCDSIVDLYLAVNKPGVSSSDIEATACGSYLFGDQTLTKSGRYTRELKTIGGNDSLIRLNLTIGLSYLITVEKSIAAGESYQFGETSLNVSGKFQQKLSSISGCDSIIELHLTVLDPVQPSVITVTNSQKSANISGKSVTGDIIFDIDYTSTGNQAVQFGLKTPNMLFAVNAETGAVTIKDAALLSFGKDTTITFIVVLSDGQSATESEFSITLLKNTVSYNANTGNNVSIYPTVTKGLLMVEAEGTFTVSIVTYSGVQLEENTFDSKAMIDISHFAAGNYVVKVSVGNSFVSETITKE